MKGGRWMNKDDLSVIYNTYTILTNRWASAWNKVNQFQLSVTQMLTLEILDKDGAQKASSLAHALSITTGGVTGLTNKLVKEKLIKRSNDVSDRRIVYLEITDLGRDTLQQLLKQKYELMENLFSDLTESELQNLFQIYKKLLNSSFHSDEK